jgi:general secretion pathway protein L
MSSARASGLLQQFLSWWLAELKAMWLPLRKAAQGGARRLTLDVSSPEWILRLRKGSRFQELGRLDSTSGASAGRKSVAALIRKSKLRKVELTVLMPESKSLRRPLTMPAISDTDLRQALFYEIERQTPFQPAEVYYDYRVLDRRAEDKRLILELTTVPRVILDRILKQVNDWGLHPAVVDVVPGNTQAGIGINLLRADQSITRWSTWRMAAAVLAVCLIGAVFYVPVSQLAAVDEALALQVAQESAKAKQTVAKRTELDQMVNAASFLDQRKRDTPSVLRDLDALTKALPDNTWLVALTQNKSEVKISGFSAAAAELISYIDAVPVFKNPTFSSPIVRDQQNNLERFEISFGLEPNGVSK